MAKTTRATSLPCPPLRRSLVALVLAVACGGDADRAGVPHEKKSAAAPGMAGAPATRADRAGRTVVARVDGEPIYDDCVANQAAASGTGLAAALDQCIDFELLAQEALRRGLVADREVLEVRRTEMVRALVETEFASTLDDPSDVAAADLRWLWQTQLARRYNKPERRRATYCRVPVANQAPVGGPEHREARRLAGELHAALSRMRGLDARQFAALCWMAAGGRQVKTTSVATRPFSRQGRYDGGVYEAPFAESAFHIPAVGQVSPPTRTSWGWDVILLTEILPAQIATLEQAEPEIRDMLIHRADTAPYRMRKFNEWMSGFLAAVRVEVFAENLPDDHVLAQHGAPAPGAGVGP